MRKSRFTESQIVATLKEADAGMKARDLCRKHGISDATYYTWKSKYGGMDVTEARRVKELERENTELKKLVGDLSLDNRMLKDVLGKSGKPGCQAQRS